jgi:uncharacterized RDD family membrane protein YckC
MQDGIPFPLQCRFFARAVVFAGTFTELGAINMRGRVTTALSTPQRQITVPLPEQPTTADWKQQLADRLNSYRAKHSESLDKPAPSPHFSSNARASRIARAVASRYATAPTYSELLLADEMAQERLLARQAAEAAMQQMDSAFQPAQEANPPSPNPHAPGDLILQPQNGNGSHTPPGIPVMPQFAPRSREMHVHQSVQEQEPSLEDLLASALIEPRAGLPSKLIEFPRELISAHRARPRLAESMTREQVPFIPELDPPQLRIFEVQPEADPTLKESEAHASGKASDKTAKSAIVTSGDAAPANSPRSDAPQVQRAAPGATNDKAKSTQSASAAQASAENKSATRIANRPSGHPAGQNAAIPEAKRPDPAIRETTAPLIRETLDTQKMLPAPMSAPPAVRAFKGLKWAAISLDKEPTASRPKPEPSVAEYVPFMVEPASIDRRVMAFAVDFAAVTGGFLAFLVVFAASTPHLPGGIAAVAAGGAVYAALWVLYQMLFFSLSGATAGMLYARIALCTFDDRNPTRAALRRRLAASWLSCLPLGLGFLWSFVDEDNLCWHDRITRMYQRLY